MSTIKLTIAGHDYELSGENVHCATCAELRRENERLRADCAIWSHAYNTDNRPPNDVVNRGRAFSNAARAAIEEPK